MRMQFVSERETPVVWFQPIVDTTDSRVFAHQCFYAGNATLNSSPVLRGLSAQRRSGLTFIDVSGASPHAVLQGIRTPRWKVVCQFRLTDPVLQSSFLCRVRELYGAEGCGFAVEARDAGPETIQLVNQLRPHYIKLDRTLVRNVEQPHCGRAVRGLLAAADEWGAIVIASGVPNQETVENLWLLGIRNMQGEVFGGPNSSIFHLQKAQSRLV